MKLEYLMQDRVNARQVFRETGNSTVKCKDFYASLVGGRSGHT